MKPFITLDETPKEGDFGINLKSSDKKPRKVVRYSEDNDTLGMYLEYPSYFKWLPLRSHHRKVIFV